MGRVYYDKEDRVALVVVSEPASWNAWDPELNSELDAIWADFEESPDVDVAVLTGEGAAFCCGSDRQDDVAPAWQHPTTTDGPRRRGLGIGGGLTRGRHRIAKPILCAVGGPALGSGFELALACDLRFASDKARFGFSHRGRGFHPGEGGIVRLVAIAGIATALDLVLTGRELSADEALHLGLVTRLVPHADLLTTTQECARLIAANDQRSLRSAKAAILETMGRPLEDALRLEAIYSGSTTADTREVRERTSELFEKYR
ncbi:MAG: enoyl-CoA hydratase/isomerase family protein [Deltaproteobacteria bacterium]|nr:enoyl-CoA hydratase/isomerase family protein [Deltaproteobacteria bacterium]